MLVKVEIDTWMELREMVWSGARDVVLEIENQGREEEALAILEDLFDPEICGHIPSDTEVNDFIWFALAEDMNLYGDDEEDEDDDEEDEDDEEEDEDDE